jgi:DNA-binding transcriptional ArsR family regulator
MVEYQAPTLDRTYAAISSNVRRAILARLATGEARVTEIARPFDMSLAAVSKHIGVLEQAGLVRRRVEGRTHWLALNPAPLVGAEEWIERTRAFWSDRLAALGSLLEEADHGELTPR